MKLTRFCLCACAGSLFASGLVIPGIFLCASAIIWMYEEAKGSNER